MGHAMGCVHKEFFRDARLERSIKNVDVLRRRLMGAMGAAMAAPVSALAQPGRTMRIGYVDNTIPLVELERAPREANTQVFLDALRELGRQEGRSIEILWRSAEGVPERRPAIFAELVRAKVDVIVVFGDLATADAMQKTRTVPIVMGSSVDPVRIGAAQSLVRPGGNVTGLTGSVADAFVDNKRLDILKRAIPKVSHLGWLHPAPKLERRYHPKLMLTVDALRMKLSLLPFDGLKEMDTALADFVRQGGDCLFISVYSFFDDPRNRDGIRALIERHRLPTVSSNSRTNQGAVLNYGPDVRAMHVSAAGYVDKILRGARPAELAIEQPRAFQLIVNLRAAKAIGVTIDPSILVQADRVIE